MQKKQKSRMDEIELAKSVLDEIIEETESEDWNKPKKESAQKGGIARAARLTDEKKSKIASKAAKAKWAKYYKEQEKKD